MPNLGLHIYVVNIEVSPIMLVDESIDLAKIELAIMVAGVLAQGIGKGRWAAA